MNQIIRNVRDELKQAADDKTKKASKSFSGKKSNATESKRQQLSKLPKNIFPKFKGWARRKTFDLCDELFESGYCEEVWVAANWA